MKEYLIAQYDLNNEKLLSALDEAPLWSVPFGMALLNEVEFKKSARVLDVCCGTGYPLIEIAQRFGRNSQIYGIDLWSAALKRAQRKIEQYGIDNIALIEGNAERMPFDNNFFDLIVSNNGLNNVEDPETALKECFRIAKKNAQLIFTMNLPETFIEFYRLFEKVLRSLGLEDEIERMKEHIYKKRKPSGYTIKMMINSGFCIEKANESSFSYRFANGAAFLNHYFIKLGFLDSWKELIKRELLDEVFTRIETELDALAEKSGCLTLQVPFLCISCRKETTEQI